MSEADASDRARWRDTWAALRVTPRDGLFEEIVGRYAEPHRAYHTLQHLRECFAHFARVAGQAERPGEILVALWFHDAIYDTRASDNEDASARWAVESLAEARAASDVRQRVRELILATKHAALPAGRDAELLVDVDLSILGADETRFAEYEQQIRFEYSWVPEAGYREGRSRVLASFLERPRVFSTPWFASHLEARARANLTRSLRALA